MKKIAILILIVNSLILLSQTKGNESFFPDLQSEIGKHFPIENLTNEKGESFSSEYLKGKVTFINFWFTTCAPCIEEIPFLNKIKNNLDSDINFIGITFDTKERVEKFLLKNNFYFSQITNMKAEMESLVRRYPMSFIIDKQGNIKRIIGKVREDNYQLVQQQILDEN